MDANLSQFATTFGGLHRMKIVLGALLALTVVTPAFASEGYYTNVSGRHVHRPVFRSHEPRRASAHCRDGSWSFSRHASGTCSHHGGVASWE